MLIQGGSDLITIVPKRLSRSWTLKGIKFSDTQNRVSPQKTIYKINNTYIEQFCEEMIMISLNNTINNIVEIDKWGLQLMSLIYE